VAELLRLSAWLDGQAGRPHGELGCAFFAADWIVANGWADPAAAWRGLLPATLRRRLARAGGLIAAVSPGLEAAGLQRVANAVRGDVAVVLARESRPVPAAAICVSPVRWITTAPAGLIAGPFQPLAIWGPVCRQ
jgi:hypothetical protein